MSDFMTEQQFVVAFTPKGVNDTLNAMYGISRGLQDIEGKSRRARNGFDGMFSAFKAAFVIREVRDIVKGIASLGDELQSIRNKIRVVTADMDQTNVVMGQTLRIANESRISWKAATDVYTRTARSVEDLGIKQGVVAQFTKTLTQAVQVGGSTSVEASNAMIQLSQGLASGALRGDELRSVMEQMPVVAKLIADHFKISTGELRAWGAEGKLSSEEVVKAITEASEQIEDQFKKMEPTVSQAWEVMKNSAIDFAEELKPINDQVAKILGNFSAAFARAKTFSEMVKGDFSVWELVKSRAHSLIYGGPDLIDQQMKINAEEQELAELDLADERHPKKPGAPPKPKREGGKTLEEIMFQIQQERGLLELSKQSNHEYQIAKELMSELGKLKKSVFNDLRAGQVDALRDMIEYNKELETTVRLNDQLAEELYKIEQEGHMGGVGAMFDPQLAIRQLNERQDAKDELDEIKRNLKNSLDPNFETKNKIGELKAFRDDPATMYEDAIKAQIAIENLNESMNKLTVTFAGVADSFQQGFSDAIARAIVLNENLGSLLRNVVKIAAVQGISSLISSGISAGIGGLVKANAINTLPGHAAGGYTGDYSTTSVAGIVHGQEYVLNAAATRNIGRQNLDAMNSGSGGMTPRITINNMGAPVQASVQSVSRGEITIMIHEAVASKAPDVVARSLGDPNSPVSKSMRRNIDANRMTR